MLDVGKCCDHLDFVAQSDFSSIFEQDESEEFCDISHLWPRMDSLTSESDRRILPRDLAQHYKRDDLFDCRTMEPPSSSEDSQLIHSNENQAICISYGCEHELINARQCVANMTCNEHQTVQDDFDDLI